jgi:hypothetical protein
MSERSEPRQTKITARLNAQGAMLEELLALLPLLRPETAREDARRAVLEENVLQRPSLGSRVDVFEKLSVRYFPPQAPQAVARMVAAMQGCADPVQLGLFAYVMLLWNDALVFRLGNGWLAPRLKVSGYTAEPEDIERELERLSVALATIRRWNASTRRRISTHYLGLLRDCGYATGTLRKMLRRPFIGPEVVLFAVELLLGGGEPETAVPGHSLFTAIGLSVSDVLDALAELRSEGALEFAAQGGVTHLSLRERRAG